MPVTEGIPILPGYCSESQFISLDHEQGRDTSLGWGRGINQRAERAVGNNGGQNSRDTGANAAW